MFRDSGADKKRLYFQRYGEVGQGCRQSCTGADTVALCNRVALFTQIGKPIKRVCEAKQWEENPTETLQLLVFCN